MEFIVRENLGVKVFLGGNSGVQWLVAQLMWCCEVVGVKG